MIFRTTFEVLSTVIGFINSLLLVGIAVWVWRRTQSRCLPWIMSCWVINSHLIYLINSWVVVSLFGASSKTNGFSLSTLSLFSKKNAMFEYISLIGLFSALKDSAIVLLIAADMTSVVHQWKPVANDRLPRFFDLVAKISPAIGSFALGLAIIIHLMWLMAQYISP